MKIFAIVTFALVCASSFGDVSDDIYKNCYEHALGKVREGDLQMAKLSFEQALSFKPNDPDAAKGLRMTEQRLNQESAASSYARVVPQEPKVAESVPSKKKDAGIRVSLGTSPGWNEFDFMGVGIDIDEEMGGQIEVVYQQRYWKDDQSTFAGVFGGGLFFYF